MEDEIKIPRWVLRGDRVDELAFANEYLMNHHMVSVNGTFFTPDGRMPDENALRKDIFRELSQYIRGHLGAKATPCATVADGVRTAIEHAGRDGVVCACGSLYICGDIRACFGLR